MKRTPLTRKSPLKRGGRVKPVNKARRQSEFARTYHSKERVAWVKAQPCWVCGFGPCDNVHAIGGGAGRKADYTTIIPLCRDHHQQTHSYGWQSLSDVLAKQDFRLALAAEVQARWERYAEGE